MLLNVILKDKTTIIVTHDEELLELANRQLYIEDGVLIEKTSPISTNKNSDMFMMNGGLLE
jgi:ABC-type lipoprotein export system ATPase subunit